MCFLSSHFIPCLGPTIDFVLLYVPIITLYFMFGSYHRLCSVLCPYHHPLFHVWVLLSTLFYCMSLSSPCIPCLSPTIDFVLFYVPIITFYFMFGSYYRLCSVVCPFQSIFSVDTRRGTARKPSTNGTVAGEMSSYVSRSLSKRGRRGEGDDDAADGDFYSHVGIECDCMWMCYLSFSW